jgi:hypothetical protein
MAKKKKIIEIDVCDICGKESFSATDEDDPACCDICKMILCRDCAIYIGEEEYASADFDYIKRIYHCPKCHELDLKYASLKDQLKSEYYNGLNNLDNRIKKESLKYYKEKK